jgi:hypothetical protein
MKKIESGAGRAGLALALSAAAGLVACEGSAGDEMASLSSWSGQPGTAATARPPSETVRKGHYLWEGAYYPISYLVRDGQAITGGDIVLDADRLLDEAPSGGQESSAQALTSDPASRWPSRNISYYIAPAGFTSTTIASIAAALASMDAQTNLTFTRLSSKPTGTSFTSYIAYNFGTSASSGVGYPGAHQVRTVTLGNGLGDDVLVHETGHALGAWHEHQRPDRDLYLTMYQQQYCNDSHGPSIDRRAVVGCGSAGWDTDFGLRPGSQVFGPFDFASVMLYGAAGWGLSDAQGLLVQPPPGSPFLGTVPASPTPAPGYAYPVMLRRGFTWPADERSWRWGNSPTLSVQDIAGINSMFPTQTIQIGWIDRGGTCASGSRGTIFMDDENTNNNTQAHVKTGFSSTFPQASNYTDAKGLFKTSQGTQINFCRESRAWLPTLLDDYAVLKLSNDCPGNSFQFSRTSDDEDTANANSNTGGIAPSSQSKTGVMLGSTTLHFCFVPGDRAVNPGAQPAPPWKASKQAAFTAGNFDNSSGCNTYHWHVKDDEDSANAFGSGASPYQFSAAAEPFAARIRSLFVDSVTESHFLWNECK